MADGQIKGFLKSLIKGDGIKHRVVVAVFVCIINVADLITDWLFYADVVKAEKGIVYGPFDPHLVNATLAFAIIGSIFFTLEILNIFLGFCKVGKIFDSDYVSVFGIIVAEIPQMVISLVVALCREEPISWFQFSKAIIIIVSMFARSAILGVKYFHKKRNGKLEKHHKKIRIFILIGNVLPIFFSVTLLCLNYLTRDDNGDPYFRLPTTDFDETLSERPYFMNVSVFMYLPELNPTYELNQTHESLVKTANWVRLTSLNDSVTNKEELFKMSIENKTTGTMAMALWSGTIAGSVTWNLTGCYEITNFIPNITNNSSCEDLNMTSLSLKTYFINLKYRQPESTFRTQLLGEVYVHVNVLTDNECREIDNYAESLEEMKNNSSLVMHYYRMNTNVSSEDTHLLRSKDQVNFYKNNDVLMADVKNVWKTGWRKCEPTGSFGPVFDKTKKKYCN